MGERAIVLAVNKVLANSVAFCQLLNKDGDISLSRLFSGFVSKELASEFRIIHKQLCIPISDVFNLIIIFLIFLGISHLYASLTSTNPGPMDPASSKNESNVSPRAISLSLSASNKVRFLITSYQTKEKL